MKSSPSCFFSWNLLNRACVKCICALSLSKARTQARCSSYLFGRIRSFDDFVVPASPLSFTPSPSLSLSFLLFHFFLFCSTATQSRQENHFYRTCVSLRKSIITALHEECITKVFNISESANACTFLTKSINMFWHLLYPTPKVKAYFLLEL